MTDLKKDPCIVVGEASESDDEDIEQKTHSSNDLVEGAIIAGEASESDYDSDDIYNITSEAFASRSQQAQIRQTKKTEQKYNSLLHKKLRESNWKLKQRLKGLFYQRMESASGAVSEVNQDLLNTQVLLQDAATNMRRCSFNMRKLELTLTDMLDKPNTSLMRLRAPLNRPL